jgi:hypothetical protein
MEESEGGGDADLKGEVGAGEVSLEARGEAEEALVAGEGEAEEVGGGEEVLDELFDELDAGGG